MHENQSVAEMAAEVLGRQARARAQRTGEPLEAASAAVEGTEAGRRLRALRDGAHREEGAREWQAGLRRGRAEERGRARQEEREWERFLRREGRGLALRGEGQLAELLGEALPGESPAGLRRLADEDRRQAEEGVVALMGGGKVYYKRLADLSPEDAPARAAAERSRAAWLQERRDARPGRGGGRRGRSDR